MAKKEGALFGATRPVPSAELKSGETRFTDHFFVISLLYYYTHFAAGVKKNICFYFSLLLSPLPTDDDVRAFLFCCVLKRHTQVFVQSKYKKGLLHNTQGSSSARFGYFFALVRLVLLVWCFFLWMLTRLGPFVQNMVAVSSLTKKKEAGE